MSDEWYIKETSGVEFGPVASMVVRQLAAQGRITASTQLRRGRTGAWVFASQISGLSFGDGHSAPRVDPNLPPQSAVQGNGGASRVEAKTAIYVALSVGLLIIASVACVGLGSTVLILLDKTPTEANPMEKPSDQGPAHELTNSIGMSLKLIPAGEFNMGHSPEDVSEIVKRGWTEAKYLESSTPSHKVKLTKSFYMSAHEVTVAEFSEFVRATRYQTIPEVDGDGGFGWDTTKRVPDPVGFRSDFNWRNTGFEQSDDHPVVNINWDDADAFCKWLSRKESVVYRLPTEAEWEWAARAGSATIFPYGDGISLEDVALHENTNDRTAQAATDYRVEFDPPVPAEDGYVFTSPVGSFPPNAFGLHDMLGNATEYCSDFLTEDYHDAKVQVDPVGPAEGKHRVVKGGAFRLSLYYQYAPASRGGLTPHGGRFSRWDTSGFRVVRELGP